ncbi:MAG: DNA-directed RNA polymerase subunit omega [Rickettsiales bacterium]|nr:DNA-directed RNA polymerase subunit omega [Rickettsiales bacterium]
MAAVTIEDCLKIIPNRFELALIASHRTEQLMNGAPMLYTSKKVEKNTVVALREIAAGLLNIDKIREELKDEIRNPALFKSTSDLIGDGTGKESDVESLSDGDLEEEGDDDVIDDTENDDDFSSDLEVEEIEDDLEK